MHKKSGVSRLVFAFKNSFAGFKYVFQKEAAFRQEVVLALPLCVFAVVYARSILELTLLVGVLVLVLIVEILNSAIECVVDRVGLEYNELSGAAKDMGSAAVLLSIVFAFLVWCFFVVSLLLNIV